MLIPKAVGGLLVKQENSKGKSGNAVSQKPAALLVSKAPSME